MKSTDIRSLFDEWNRALATRSASQITQLYEEDAILLPTISNQVRHNHQEIEDYFVQFLALGPQGRIDEANIRIINDIAINSGTYTFSFDNGPTTQARYSFIYRWNGKHWKIIEHHSSRMPE